MTCYGIRGRYGHRIRPGVRPGVCVPMPVRCTLKGSNVIQARERVQAQARTLAQSPFQRWVTAQAQVYLNSS